MIDTSKAKWDLSKEEKYAIKWFNEHGFDGEIVKQYMSKTKFIVSKDGITDNFELIQGIPNIKMKKYMEQYERSFVLLCQIQRMKEIIQKIGQSYDFFCVDCGKTTRQTYKGVYVDGSHMYICQECGCENYEEPN